LPAEYAGSAGTPRPDAVVRYYVERLASSREESKIIPESGHWVAEEAPEQLLAALTPFLAPYRDATSR
jgi:pimeloyl-ACP methyl ester carboxylesterase